jgi:DNA polymerase-3 subunit alpha
MNYPGYFLIVADFIQWAKAHGIPVGPGRGSGAGSLVACGADDHRSRSAALRPAVRALPQSRARVDAGLRHRLLPGPARRGDPLRAQNATATTGSRRSSPSARCRRARVLRDVGRVLQMPYGQVDRLAKLVPAEPRQTR